MSQLILSFDDFLKVDMRVGTVVSAEVFHTARKPAYKLIIDFGPELGLKKSSAQITQRYTCEELIGAQVIAVVNFPPKQIGNCMSEVLVLGLSDIDGAIVLMKPQNPVPNGSKVH